MLRTIQFVALVNLKRKATLNRCFLLTFFGKFQSEGIQYLNQNMKLKYQYNGHKWVYVQCDAFYLQGMMYPPICSLVPHWFLNYERSTTVSFFSSGNQIASILGNPMAAFFCTQKQWIDGWPLIFYACGIQFIGVLQNAHEGIKVLVNF